MATYNDIKNSKYSNLTVVNESNFSIYLAKNNKEFHDDGIVIGMTDPYDRQIINSEFKYILLTSRAINIYEIIDALYMNMTKKWRKQRGQGDIPVEFYNFIVDYVKKIPTSNFVKNSKL